MRKNILVIFNVLMFSSVLFAQPYASNFQKEKNPMTGNLTFDSGFALADSNQSMIENFFNEKPKHPFKAAIMSAIIPGSGEFYSESYISAGSFFAAEVILLSTYVYFNNEANEKEIEFQKVADDPKTGWFVDKYASFLLDKANGDASLGTLSSDLISAMGDHYKGDYDPDNGISYDASGNRSYWSLLNQLEKNTVYDNGNTYSHVLPGYGSQQYYELIGKYDQFSAGWSDYSGYELKPSAAFLAYRDMRKKANDTHDLANNLLIAVFLNHAASAITAALQANWYNKNVHVSLLHKKISEENWYAANINFTF